MKPVCFLDLDGVLVDFVKGAYKLHSQPYDPAARIPYDFMSTFGISNNEFWAPMDFDFWAGLGWTTEGKELLRGLERLFGQENIVLLTSPCLTVGSVEGKIEWIRQNLPAYSRQFFVGPCKHLAAGPDKILIDDHDDNCIKFLAYGGHARLVPRPWNAEKNGTEQGLFDINQFLYVTERIVGKLL